MEAPFIGIPSINIGTRQEGRLRAKSVIDVKYDKNEIKNAIKKILYDKKFRKITLRNKGKSPYGVGTASSKIVAILEQLNLKQIPIQKKMSY